VYSTVEMGPEPFLAIIPRWKQTQGTIHKKRSLS
jgi:hypothetical protein